MNTSTTITVTINSADWNMFKSFAKYAGIEQEGQNNYTQGCIQCANAMMPIIAAVILEGVDIKQDTA